MILSEKLPFFAILLLLALPFPSWADEKSKERLFSEGPKAWDALAAFGLKGSLTRTKNYFPNAKKLRIQVQSDFIIRDSLVLIQSNYKKMLGDTIVQRRQMAAGNNSNYFFALEKKGPPVGGPVQDSYVLKTIGKPIPSEEFYQTLKPVPYVRASWTFGGRPLKDWLKAPKFLVLEVVPVRLGFKNLVRMKAKQEIADEKADPFQATFLFDPEKFWCTHEFKVEFQGLTETWSLKYGKDIDGMPVVEQITVELAGKEGSMVESCQFENVVHWKGSEREISLTAFGLPEPKGIIWQSPNKGSRWWLWFIGLAVVSLALGRFLWLRFQRAKALLASQAQSPRRVHGPTGNH